MFELYKKRCGCMAIRTTYSKARNQLADLCNRVAENREVVYISRRNAEDVALISVSELTALLETAHLLRSPANAQRLLTALHRALEGSETPLSLDKLKRDIGMDASQE